MLAKAPFSGSYTAVDVEFLLTPITLADTPIAVKEALIQSGQMHYSQLLTHEKPPSEAYVTLFHQALALISNAWQHMFCSWQNRLSRHGSKALLWYHWRVLERQ